LLSDMKAKLLASILLGLALVLAALVSGCGPKAPKAVLDAEDQYLLGKGEFDKGHWEKAVVELQKLVFNYPGAAFIDSAQYLLGMAYFNQKEYPSAILEFDKILYSYPTSPLADDAAFMVAKSDFEMSPRAELDPTHTQKALDGARRFLEDYPESDRTEEAEELLNECRTKLAKKAYQSANLYYKRGQYESALLYLKHVLNDFHDTEWFKLAQFKTAEVFHKQKEYEKARQEYEKFLQDYPDDKLAKKAKKRLKQIPDKSNQGEE
jgi:outer membrane protein assembly factor BamD